jgi:hypothetical protein
VFRVTRIAAICLTLLLGLITGCGSKGKDAAAAKPASQDQAARTALKSVKPIASARVDALLRITLDNAPAAVGSSLQLSLKGPLRSNGPGKLPSLDWKLAFDGLNQQFSSRIVSTGDNLFVRLGGADFAVGEEAIANINRQSAQAKGGDGLAAIGIDPLAALKDVRKRGQSTVAGAPTTHYVGTVDMNKLLDQVQRFLRTIPRQAAAGQATPQLELTPQRRLQVAQTFAAPQVEVDVGSDDTIRGVVLSTRFTTPAANRQAAGGITGGTIEYRLQYSDVGSEVKISPVKGARPIEEFSAALQRELSR